MGWKFWKKFGTCSIRPFFFWVGWLFWPSWRWPQAMCALGYSGCLSGAYELVAFRSRGHVCSGVHQRRKSHIVVDILTETFSEGVKKALDGISYLIGMVFFALISWVIFRWGIKIADSGEVSETLKIAYYPFIYCVALGFAFLWLTLLLDFLNTVLKKGGNPAS
jgi:hypothetical protein